MKFPNAFMERMKDFLGEEFDDYVEISKEGGKRGIRINPLKATIPQLQRLLPFELTPSPFCRYGFYISNDTEKIGTTPLHHAGAFYVQEPSATSAVTILAPERGDKVLDLCAAPGGKSTQIAGELMGEGLLWSNEIVSNRASILLSNIERLGVRNAVVTSEHPDILCSELEGFFDKVLVDAPCSGEGMFLHDSGAVDAWSPEHTQSCAVRQKGILNSAARALRHGGILVYSTCTYSIEENEDVIQDFLKEHSEFELVDCGVDFGRESTIIPETRRIYPMDGGDGHFIAKLRKKDSDALFIKPFNCQCSNETESMARELFKSLTGRKLPENIHETENAVYIIPDDMPSVNIGILRAGVRFAEKKKNRLEPAHHFYSSIYSTDELLQVLDYKLDSKEIREFLRGEQLKCDHEMSGYCGIAVEGIMLGFGKCSGGHVKNHYPKGLRNLL